MAAHRDKTGKADALGIAHIMRTGWIPTGPYQVAKLLPDEAFAEAPAQPEGHVPRPGERHLPSLKAFSVRLGKVGRGAFEKSVRTAVAEDPLSSEVMDAMLSARAALWRQYCRLHDLGVRMVARSELCRRTMAIPGPVTALSFMTAIDDPSRFRRSRDVAAFGLTSRRSQSGASIDVQGRISKAGDADVRRSLYEAASGLMTRFKGRDKVKSCGQAIAKRSCHRKACVAVARKLAVIIHAIWTGRTFYVCDPAASQADAGRRAHDKAGKRIDEQKTDRLKLMAPAR